MTSQVVGRVNSFQSLGASDGPGVRFVVFLQGCNLRCGCCHNPDTWDMLGASLYSAKEIAERCHRYKEYFGEEGGITVSGGEPLLQAKFVYAIFKECHKLGINTCLDTSGSLINEDVKKLLSVTDHVLLDIKYQSDHDYRTYVGCGMDKPLEFLSVLDELGIATVLRRVIIPTLTDKEDDIVSLKKLKECTPCVKKVELLPFRKLCKEKYERLKINFPFEGIPEPTTDIMNRLNALLM